MVVSAERTFSPCHPDADPRQLAMLAINPSDRGAAAQRVRQLEARRLGGAELRQFRGRAVGDRVCETRGLKTVNIVRRPGARDRAQGYRRRYRRRRFS